MPLSFIENAAFGSSNIITANGIQFPATQVPSANANTLDDYEEGTFTARVGSASVNFNMTEDFGYYLKVGKLVFIEATVTWSSYNGANTSDLVLLKNLPFTALNSSGYRIMGMLGAFPSFNAINVYSISMYGSGSTNSIGFEYRSSLSGGANNLTVGNITSNGGMRVSMTYIADV